MGDVQEEPVDPRVGVGSRFARLLAILGLTGFAVSQPVLAVAGENPSLFAFAGVEGTGVVTFAVMVALVPPLVVWGLVEAVGLVRRSAGFAAFLGAAGILFAIAVAQWVRLAGLDARVVGTVLALAAGVGFAVLLVRVPAVGLWLRYTAILPVLSLVLFLFASPSGELRQARSEAASGGGEHPSVVFIMFDEFPLSTILAADGGVDEVRFPNLAALAEESSWYRNYTVSANATLHSVPSTLTGREPTGAPALWTSYPDSIFSLLAPTHDLTVSETATQLCGFTSCALEGTDVDLPDRGLSYLMGQMADVLAERTGFEEGGGVDFGQFAEEVETLDPETDVNDPDSPFDEEVRPARVSAFLDALGTDRSPSLSYLHVMLPHQPWKLAPDGRPFEGLNILDFSLFDLEPDEWDLAVMQQSHIFQAQYADRVLGDIVARLKETGRYNDSLLVVTSDHGVSFDRDVFPNLRALDESTLTDLAYVPLFVKEPGQAEAVVDDQNLLAVDLLPTIAEAVDVDIPWEVSGHPAGDPAIDARGDDKVIQGYDDDFGLSGEAGEVIEFQSSDHRPTVADRAVGPIAEGDHPLAGLLALIDADGWLGTTVSDVPSDDSAGVTFANIARLTEDDDQPLVGLLRGQAEGFDAGDVVLLAVDGVVETGAPVSEDGFLTLLVPPDAPRGAGTEVRLLRVDGTSLTEVELAS